MQLGPGTAESTESQLMDADSNPQAIQDSSTPGGWLDRIRAENSMLPNILLIAGVMVLVLLVMRQLKRTTQKNRRRTNTMGTPSERISEINNRAHASMEPGRKVMVDAEDMARRLSAALDNKAARLELLIEEADQKLDQLNRAMVAQHPQSTSAQSPLPQDAARPLPQRSIDPTLLDRARLEQDQEERQTRVAGRIEPTAPDTPAQPTPSISDQIHQLAAQGLDSNTIAQTLKQPIGQVELILNLKRRAEQS